MGGVSSPGRRGAGPARPPLPRRSDWVFRGFRAYARRYVARHVRAVRLARGGYRPGADGPDDPPGPVVVVLNHASWWDPLVGVVLLDLFPGRTPYAPIDAEALARYPVFERLGMFPVEPDSPRGGLAFLRSGLAVMGDPAAMLWLTAQGRFADPRERPVRLKEGVGHLARRCRVGSVLPLALEYPFWDERTPEALARFGPPLPLGGADALPADAWTARIAAALGDAQDALAADAVARDPSRFETLLGGAVGVGGPYDVWRRVRAALRGERFDPGHGRAPQTPK